MKNKLMEIILPQQISKRLKYKNLYSNNCKIGDYCKIDDIKNIGHYVILSEYSTINNSKIDNYTSVGRNSRIFNASIGKFCSISWNVTVGATEHPYYNMTTHAFPYVPYAGNFVETDNKIVKNVILENDVWIGCNVVIMPGIRIGSGAVIGAGSVVTKDIEPYGIYAGVPAKLIKYRFNSDIIERLLNFKWWDREREWIEENIVYFQKRLDEGILDYLEKL